MNKKFTKNILNFLLLIFITLSSGCEVSQPFEDKNQIIPTGKVIYSNALDIYVYDFESDETKNISNRETKYLDLLILDNFIYFVGSNKEPPFLYDIYKMGIDGSNLEKITNVGNVQCISGPSHGTKLTYVTSNENQIIVYDTKQMTHNVLAKNSWCPTWSPDGEKFIFFEDPNDLFFNKAFIYTIKDMSSKEISAGAHNHIVSWLPDSESVMLQIGNVQDSYMAIYNLKQDKFETFRLDNENLFGYRCNWSINPAILFCKTTSIIQVFDLNNFSHNQSLETNEKDWYYPSVWSPDGKSIVYFETIDEIITSSEVDKHIAIDIVKLKIYNIVTKDSVDLEIPIAFINSLFWIEQ